MFFQSFFFFKLQMNLRHSHLVSLFRGIGGEFVTAFGCEVGGAVELGASPVALGAMIRLDKAVALPCVSE